MRRVWLTVGAVLSACALLATPAGAASWTGQLPPPVPAANGELEATSCPAADWCEAVGAYVGPAGWQVPEAQHWNGSNWSVQTPQPWPGSVTAHLDAISCRSSTACMTLGIYRTSTGATGSFSETFDGAGWSRHPVATPPGGSSATLTAVSCPGATVCFAVGSYQTGQGATAGLVERWNGTSWAVQSIPGPQGATSWTLTGVSCHTNAACTAAGSSHSLQQNADTAIAEVFDATGWQQATLALPAGAASSDLDAISCSGSNACTAVGHYSGSDFLSRFFAARRAGISWTVQSMPVPANIALINSVSCPTVTACTAVGSEVSSSGRLKALADSWNGAAWTRQTAVTPAIGGQLSGISCATASACTAVGATGSVGPVVVIPFDRSAAPALRRAAAAPSALGASDSAPLAPTASATSLVERFNGSGWSAQTTVDQAGASPSDLDGGVSCSAADACTAVGTYFNPRTGAFRNLAERWNGSEWTVQDAPDSPHETDSYLTGVSCSAAKACMAIGTYSTNQFVNFSMAWDGARWTLHDMPLPAGASQMSVFAVSCSAPTACTAVGDYTVSGGTLPLAERWDGSHWTLQTVTPPAGSTYFVLTGVSCLSSGCVALGSPASGPSVAERWTGGGWTAHKLARTVFEVSCRALTACEAVGQSPGQGSSAEGLSGTTWAPQTVPPSLFALSVSCATASGCEAVGANTAAGWNGSSWTAQVVPQPHGTGADGLRGVSCTAATVCMAVGRLDRSVPVPLAQRYS